MYISRIPTLKHDRPAEDALVYLCEALDAELHSHFSRDAEMWITDAGRVMGIGDLFGEAQDVSAKLFVERDGRQWDLAFREEKPRQLVKILKIRRQWPLNR